jgi:hypothetical protein
MVFGLFKSKPKKVSPPDEMIEKYWDEVIDEFANGDYGDSFDSNLLLRKGEHLILDLPQIELCEERTVKMKGGHQGFSIRIMKGVSYRFGSFEGGREMKVVPLDSGSFIITNKRILFSGSTTQRDFPLNKINTIDVMENGITLSRSGKTKTEYYIGFDVLKIPMTITPDENEKFDEYEHTFIFDGYHVRQIIQKLIQKL